MEEIDLRELLELFWNKKSQVILLVLIFMVLGVIYTIGFTTPMYSSSTTLVLASTGTSQTTASTDSITATDITMNSKLVSTYSELVKSKNVLRQVISNLGIDVEEEELRKNITVSAVKDTELIEITVMNKNPSYSSKIANEIAKVFTEKVREIYKIDNVQIVDNAETATNPSNINHKRDIAISTALGFVVACMYILVANVLDTTVKTQEDIEKNMKIPVLACIPMYDLSMEKQNNKRKGGRRA